jgi:hypothetical protein
MGLSGLRILAMSAIGMMASGTQAADAVLAPETGPATAERPRYGVPGDDRPILLPATRGYQWIFHVPVFSIERRHIYVTAPSTTLLAKRYEYEVPALREKRFKLWDAPEFSCKYADLILPNECRTVWHGVYVDLPVLVSQHTHLEVDVPQVRLKETLIAVDVPTWTWTEKSFRFSIPALAPPESVEQVRVSLNGQRAAVTAATDEAIASIDRQIELLRAKGEDPTALDSSDGSRIDLVAQRKALLDERAQELERLAAIDGELSALATQR